MSEALIFASTDPQYDNGLFIELPDQYIKIVFFFFLVLTFRTINVCNMFWECSELAISMYWTGINNLLSYCGLVDARISASEKDLPVHIADIYKNIKVYGLPKTFPNGILNFGSMCRLE